MTARQTFRRADLERAIAAAKQAGLAVKRAEVWPDGRIVLSESETDDKKPDADPFDMVDLGK